MWATVIELAKDGRAIMVHSQSGEQRLAFKVHRHHWEPVDIDGILLMLRPEAEKEQQPSDLRKGWSKASKYRRAAKPRAQPS